MKVSAKTTSRVEMINELGATITLQQNSTAGKKDKADNSVGMALMADENVVNKVNLATGKAVNKGTITLKDNIANSLGMFVNIDSNMTNQGTINVNTIAIDTTTKKYKPSVGMRADQVESKFSTATSFDTTVINDKTTGVTGKISLTGQGNIGMLASGKNTTGPNGKGTATAINKGEINIDKGTGAGAVVAKDNYGMLSISEGSVINEVDGKITLGTAAGSVGMAALKETNKHSTAENKGIITVNGAKSTGVYNTGHFLMDNTKAEINVKGNQSIGLYAYGTDATHTKTELKQGKVTAANSGVGLYSDKATVNLDNSTGNLKLIANDGGLLFYNYDSGVSGTPVANGKFRLVGSRDIAATINNGGYAFYLKNTTIQTNGSITGLAAFFNSMFDNANSTKKIDITLNPGGTLMILDKPTGGNIKLSSVATASSIASSLGNRVAINSASTKYKVYAVYRGKLEIDQNVNLNNDSTTASPDAFYKVDFRSSSMTLNSGKTVAGTKQGQVALFQGNYDEGGTSKGKVGDISITNLGTIKLSGNSITTGPAASRKTTTAMAGDFITLTNKGTIEVSGNNGVGIYGAGGSKVTNAQGGTIAVGQEGVALYGANRLGSSTLGDRTISVTNAGTLKGINGKTKAFGIFAENTLAINKSVLTNKGTIAMQNGPSGNLSSTAIAVETGKVLNDTGSKIQMTGEKAVAIYGATDSDITNKGEIEIATKGTGIVGANSLEKTGAANQNITILNDGKITGTAGEKVIGIYANNTHATAVSKIKNDTNGIIDLTATKGSLGIYAGKSNLETKGNIKVGDESAGVNAVNSTTVVSGGNVEVGTKSIGFILEGIGKTSTTTFDGQAAGTLKINGQNSLGYYLVNADANTATNFKDNLVFNPGNNKYTYIYVKGNSATDRSKLVYNQAGKTIDTDSSVFIFGKDSDIKLDTAFTLTSTKNKVVAAYLKDSGTLTNEGSIDLSGDKSVALYGEAGGAIVNNKDIKIGTNSVGIYNKGASTGENGAAGTITLDGDYGIGMRSDNATGNTENKGKIESSKLRAVGMSSSNGSNAMTNTGTIDFSGQESIGMHTDNLGTAGHAVTNNGTITLVDANDETKPNIGIYSEHSNDVIVNNGKIEAGKNTLGIYGKAGGNITLGSASETKVGDNGVSVFTTGGNVDILNGAKVETGANNGVGVYYSGSNGTITNNTDKIKIGDNSFGFVIKGGTNNKFFSNSTGTVQLPDKSVYLYSADTTGTENTVINRTNLESTGGELVYGIYTNGGGANYGNINMTQGKGHVGIYSYLPHPTGAIPATVTPNVFKNYGRIDVSASDLTVATDQKNGIGMAAGYVKQRTEVENVLDANGNVIIDPVTGNPKTQTKIYRDIIGLGNIENHGTISVTTPNSIGMYAGGKGSIAKNYGRIELSGTDLNVGMFLEDGAVGYNYGTITTVGTGNSEQVGVAVLREATFHNYGKVNIDAEDGIGIAIGGKLTLVNRGEFTISGDRKTANMNNGTGTVTTTGDGSVAIATISDDSKIMGVLPVNQVGIIPKDGTYEAVVTYNGVEVPNVQTVDVIPDLARGKTTIQTAPIGIYVDTTGVNATRPVNNLGLLSTRGIKYADLIIGTEAAEQTNEKYLKLSKDLIAPYNDMILQAQRQGLRRWQIYSSSLTWMAKAVQNKNTQVIENLYLVKVPYTVWVGQQSTPINSTDTFNFAEGLDQRYGVEAVGTREKQLFNKLNSIGKNEQALLTQAYDEMMGHQYANTQQRIYGTGRLLEKEFTHLKKEWDTKSKQSNKIKAFGMRDEYSTDTAGVIDYTSNAYGFAYLHEDETVKLGNSSGWYAGAVHNRFKFKDIGRSKEDQTMLKLGIFRTMSPASDHNGSLQWTVSGEGYVTRNDMHRKYLVVDEIFNAKSTYNSYGVALKNELGYNIRTSERTSIRPYGSLKLEYGRTGDIEEKTGEVRLEVKGNDYYSIRPELGVEFTYRQPMAVKTTFVTTLGLGYENELGKVGNVGNKARVNYTNADWFNIPSEKDDRRGNFKADLNIGVENQRFGVTVNGGYDTKGKNIRGGIGFRAIY